MDDVSKFILSTDYATSKDDGNVSEQVVFPGGLTISSDSYLQWYKDIDVGTRGSIIRSRIASSKDSNIFYSTSSLSYSRGDFFISVYAFVTRISPTTVRLWVITTNPYNFAVTGEAGDEIFTFELSTIIAPVA